jgi:hypothetical protein
MSRWENIVDNIPAFLVSILLAVLFAVFAFIGVSVVTSMYALGIDFAIIVGLAGAITAGITSFVIAFRKLRP